LHPEAQAQPQEEEDDDDEEEDDDDDSLLNNNMEMYGFAQSENKPEQAKQQAIDLKSKEIPQRKGNQQQQQQQQQQPSFNQFMGQQQMKSEMTNPAETNFSMNQENKKQKGKPGLQLNGNIQENGPRQQQQQKTPNNEMSTKIAPMNNDLNESMFNTNNPYEQQKSLADASQFMAPNMDSLKRLDQMNAATPFQFYPNNRLRPFNNVGIPFMNEDTINSMFKNYSSFPFQLPGNVPFMGKGAASGEMDEKMLDPAKVLNYLQQQAGSTPLNRQGIFAFPQNDYQKMQTGDPMRQGNPVGGPEFHGSFMEDNHDELIPTLFKGDPRFDPGLPSGPLNNRRYNFDGYMNGYEEDFGEKTKKFKHN